MESYINKFCFILDYLIGGLNGLNRAQLEPSGNDLVKATMIRVKIVDYILIACIFFVFYTVFIAHDSKNDIDLILETNSIREIKEDIREMCQFLEHDVIGEEGDDWLKGNDYENELTLRGLLITFRHGERSSIDAMNMSTACLPTREIDRRTFEAYKTLVDSDGFKEFLNIDSSLGSFPRYPENAMCSSGNLTAEGALQHIRLGKFLKRRYEKSKLLTEDNRRIVADITTSNYPRTFQSALAFASEFFYTRKELFARINVKASNVSYQCTDAFCVCPFGKNIRQIYEEEHYKWFVDNADREMVDEAKFIMGTFPKYRNAYDPFQLIDISLGHYICRRKTLPCDGNKCISYEFLNKIIDFATNRGSKMFDEGNGVAKRLQIIESYPILSYLSMTIDRIRRFPHSNFVKIFSAHDSVVGPILRVLGIPFIDPPHYTSRIVFEIYEHTNEGLYLRVLYNGRSRTDEIRFCGRESMKYGMCKASEFEEFVKQKLFKMVNTTNLNETCYL